MTKHSTEERFGRNPKCDHDWKRIEKEMKRNWKRNGKESKKNWKRVDFFFLLNVQIEKGNKRLMKKWE